MTPSLGSLVTDLLESSFSMTIRNIELLQIGLDGSGCVNTDRYIAYGTVGGFAAEWQQFEQKWTPLLNHYGLDHIRMAHAMSFQGEFKKKRTEWGEHRHRIRDEVLVKAATIVRDILKPAGTTWDFGQVPTEKVFSYRKNLMFGELVLKTLRESADHVVLAFICDDEQDAAPEYYRLLNRFKAGNKKYARRIGGICFFNDARMPQLQAADMAAYVLRQKRMGQDSPLYPILFRDTPVENEQE